MEIVFAYLAGLLTLINPCVLPVLPIVLGSALQASPRGPLALAAGMSLSFVSLGLLVSGFGYALGIDEVLVGQIGASLMIAFGAVLLVPRFSHAFASATGGIAAGADQRITRIEATGARGQFLGGLLLGAVWSPCVGPTLGGAISLAASGESLMRAGVIMLGFAAGVSTLILGLGYGARGLLARHRAGLQRFAQTARPLLGVLFIAVGLAILFRLHHLAEAWALRVLPPWFLDLSVAF
ncbi:Cytochrome c biogenesis protein CcdA [Pseudooceanicola antarcticus]|uniref:Cytochrome c biogenesis protein CcdA n=1 Tax=Pseudooceanicola antarcticus TaxID=1247613 RepID=A0A285HQA2_9RHOB|nr:cytochrome c biogenesis CcdA family protein [Pseudooceanicola antarcticus]PJE27680.1 cytochrome c biogenesis protein CcdA [Pseudooceanicola antarcticus]SNY37834.1 Cytochrome c biogenesis protein CcdA [Pseudooceanicola antarcticus]